MATDALRPLAGRVALVTGVSRKAGIGYAIAQRLAQQGAHLFLHGLASYDAVQPWGADYGGMAEIVNDLRAYGGKVHYVSADFVDPDAPTRVMGTAKTAFGHVDMLVVNHAYSQMGRLHDLTAQDIDMHMIINLRASLLLTKEFAAQYDGRLQGGRVVFMVTGQHRGAMPDELAYIASKGALHQVTQSLAVELAPRNITVNAVNPGPTQTGWADRETYEAIQAQHPMGRWGEPDDAARLVAWLLSDDAKWVTGQLIDSTGGF